MSSSFARTREWVERFKSLSGSNDWEKGEYGAAGDWPLLWMRRIIPDSPVVYISSGMHGDEPAAVEALCAELVSEPEWLDKISVLCCPILNPEGCALGVREDASGRDLNRDYRKFDSATTRAHRDWLDEQHKPELCISLHEDWETVGFYLYEINTAGREEIGRRVLQKVGREYVLEGAEVIDGHVVSCRGYIFHPPEADLPEEWPEAIWLVKRAPCLSVTLESPSSIEFTERVAMHRLALETVVEEFLRSTGV